MTVLGLILLFLVGEIGGFDILDVFRYRIGNYCAEVGIATQKTRRKALVDAKHIVHHKHLTVDTATGTDAYDGDGKLLSHFCGKGGRDFFQHDGKASYLLKQASVLDEFVGFSLFASAYGVRAELVD